MQYPFLKHNELVLIDYVPGSSGQLLLRLWSELDSKLNYENNIILTPTSIDEHPSTREIDFDILLPKRLTNWFVDRWQPANITDYASYFEFVGVALMALAEKWKHGGHQSRFYHDDDYHLVGYKRVYGHSYLG